MTTARTLFAFQPGTGWSGWQVVNDGVMGGISTSDFQLLPGGGAVFSGNVSLENQGGFASVRSRSLELNLDGLDAFTLRVRGDGHRFKFSVRTEPGFDGPLYQCGFATQRAQWQECRLPFAAFVPTFRGRVLGNMPPFDPVRVTSVGLLIAEQQDGPFRLEIACIAADARVGLGRGQ